MLPAEFETGRTYAKLTPEEDLGKAHPPSKATGLADGTGFRLRGDVFEHKRAIYQRFCINLVREQDPPRFLPQLAGGGGPRREAPWWRGNAGLRTTPPSRFARSPPRDELGEDKARPRRAPHPIPPPACWGRGTAARSAVVEGHARLRTTPPPRFARSPSPRRARGGIRPGPDAPPTPFLPQLAGGGGPRREAPGWRGNADSEPPLHHASRGPPPRDELGEE